MRRLFASTIAVILALGSGASSAMGQANTSPPPQPNSIAAIGDSITRAADVCCWYGDHPANSWSTGGASWDGITSHYERLRALNPNIVGHNHNNAVSGARMSDGPTQAKKAVAQQAGYVTILLGANDLCTSSPRTMTRVDTFRGQLRETLQILRDGLPAGARIFVSSIPDVYQLWQIYHTDWLARAVWDLADICQSLLAPSRTAAQRAHVRDRNIALNDVLQAECAQIARCLYDGNAVFSYQFTRRDVSKLDYFHPSLSGQAHLAQRSWAASWWN